MAYNYVATLHKPTVVRFSCVGAFTSSGAKNLIVGYSTRLVVYDITPEGLAPVCDDVLFGNLEMMELFRPKNDTVDYLFLAFEDQSCCAAKWDPTQGRIATISKQTLNEPLLAQPDTGKYINAAMDPSHSLVAFNLFIGQLKVVRIKPNGMLAAPYKVRLEQTKVTDMCFLDRDAFGNKGHPTLAVLHPGPRELTELKIFHLPLGEEVIQPAGYQQENLEAGAVKLTRAPGGVLVYGEQLIAYLTAVPASKHMQNTTIRIADFSTTEQKVDTEDTEPTLLCAWCHVDDRSLLMSAETGKIYGLTVKTPGKGNANGGVSLRLEALGYTSRASCLSWIGGADRHMYLGSDSGDSMMVQMLEQRADDGSWIDVVDVFPSLGPMTGFILCENTAGSDQMVACCGSGKDGSLRIVRNGIGITDVAAVEIGGVQDMWTLMPHGSDKEQFVVMSFVGGSTKILEVRADELAETEIGAFASDATSLWCGNVSFNSAETGVSAEDFWVQVTANCVRLADRRTRDLHATFFPEDGAHITLGTSHGSSVVVACGSRLLCLALRGHELTVVARAALDDQISCLSLLSLAQGASSPTSHAPITTPPTHIAIGLWNCEHMHLLDVADLSVVATEALGADVLARSFQLLRTEGKDTLLCGLGDGSLVVWNVTQQAGAVQLTERKRIQMGTQPVRLQLIETITQQSSCGPETKQAAVFVCSDKPAVVAITNGRLQVSPVNLKAVPVVCPFNSPLVGEGNHLVFNTDGRLVIGSIDGMQKLHVRNIPLNNEPTSVALHQSSHNYIVTLYTEDPGALNTVTVVADYTYEPVSHFNLDPDEMAMCCICTRFADDPTEYIVVGTVYIDRTEELPRNGRILVFTVSDNQPTLTLVAEHATPGNVTKLVPLQGKLLAGVNSAIHLLKWEEAGEGRQFVLECSHRCHLNIISIDVRDDYVAVGDIYRSMSVFQYKPEDSTFEDISHDGIPRRVTAAFIADDNRYILAEDANNLVMLEHEKDSESESDTKRLVRNGYFHLGETVNTFARGCLTNTPSLQYAAQNAGLGGRVVDNEGDLEDQPVEPLLFADPANPLLINTKGSWVFGTSQGSIGTLSKLTYSQFTFLELLQNAAAQNVMPVGNITHSAWRAFRYANGHREAVPEPSKNFIDGDLIEAVLHAQRQTQTNVLRHFNKLLAKRAKDMKFEGFKDIDIATFIDILNYIVSPH